MESDANRSDGFWIAYVLIGFQAGTKDDFDPHPEDSFTGITSSLRGGECFICIEQIVDIDRHYAYPQSIDEHIKNSITHEVGHELGLGHKNGMIMGAMGNGAKSFHPKDQAILRSQVKSPGK